MVSRDKISEIWAAAESLRGGYRHSEYGRVILPLLLLRRLEQVLAPTRKAVLEADVEFPIDEVPGELRERMLHNASGELFYNTCRLELSAVVEDPSNAPANLLRYIHGFSQNVRAIMERFRFDAETERLHEANLLIVVLRRFVEIDLGPYQRSPDGSMQICDKGRPVPYVTNWEMGEILEELLKLFAEQSGETVSEHSTPADVRELMVALLLAGDEEALSGPGKVLTVYDPAAGTGGLFTAAAEHVRKTAPDNCLEVSGQELNAEYQAICAANLLMRGLDPCGVALGDTLAQDRHSHVRVDYLISDPPFGLNWSRSEEKIRHEHEQQGYSGRFGPGLPRKNDGTLLFLLHMASKMKPVDQGGSRMAVVTAGPSLFSGSAGSGESEIRRWIIENDLLEAIVALPGELFNNTAIPTYVWLLTNRKGPHQKGRVRLINGRDYYRGLRHRSGAKRREFTDDDIRALVDLHGTSRDHPDVLVLRNEDLGHQRVELGRPLRLGFQTSEERLARLEEDWSWQELLKPDKGGGAGQKDVLCGEDVQKSVLKTIRALDSTRTYKSRHEFDDALQAEATAQGVTIPQAIHKAVLRCLSERDETAELCMKNGAPEFDPEFRRFVEIPLGVDVTDHLEQEVRPEYPEASIRSVQVGFAFKRIAHLGFGLRRELDTLRSQYEGCQLLSLEQVCVSIRRRRRRSTGADSTAKLQPHENISGLRSLMIETNEEVLLSEYLAMFFHTEIGKRLLEQLNAGSSLRYIAPEDLGQLIVPVPTVKQQRALLETKGKIDDLTLLLTRIEAELAANPANIGVVQEAVVPMFQALGQMSEADEIRDLVRGGESKRVEFKETFSLDIRKQTRETYIEESALKNVVAFLNSEGGDLLVGVADDGDIKGVEPELEMFHRSRADKLLLHVKNRFKTRIGEQFYPLMQQKLVVVDGATVLWVHCDESESPVYLDDKSFYVRTNPATDKLEGRKQFEYIKRRFGLGEQK